MLFRKKTTAPEPAVEITARIQTIPDIFYGGNDPEIYHPKTSGSVSGSEVPLSEQKTSPRSSFGSGSWPSRTIKIGFGIGLFVLAVAGISWYYVREYYVSNNKTVDTTPPPPVFVTTATTTIETPVIPLETSVTSTPPTPTPEVPTSTRSLAGGPMEFPPINNFDSSDFDADSLTDLEEELFETDSAAWDTDKDGYYDGQELFNLYNPKGFAPVKLIDSGLVQEYSSPLLRYRLYYPNAWQVGMVDTEGKQVLFSTISGDYVEARVVNANPGSDFATWFASAAIGERITDLTPIVNRFGISGWKRKDDMTAYFMQSNQVYILIYHPITGGPLAYRHVMHMMVQSFRPNMTMRDLPEQVILPGTATDSPALSTTSSTSSSVPASSTTSTLPS